MLMSDCVIGTSCGGVGGFSVTARWVCGAFGAGEAVVGNEVSRAEGEPRPR